MYLEHDREADAIYITLREGTYAYGEDLDGDRRVDYDSDGQPIGIELLNVSMGVEPDDLPEQEQVLRLLERAQIKTFA